jgi:hypothetical protein
MWSHATVDRNGCKNFRTNQDVKGRLRRREAVSPLDILICSEERLAIAIDGFL